MPGMIAVQNLTYSYPHAERPALCDVSFSIPAGQFVALIGPTGAGKSTLCYSLCGAAPRLFGGDFTGAVTVAGLDTYDHDIPILAQHVGLVVQNARNQLFNVTVQGEVAFGCENLGFPREQIRKNLEQALAFVGLSGYELREPAALSGGQQQRVALACVLAMQPEVLVLDEPTSELDPVGSEQVMEVIGRLNRELGKTILLVSHDSEFIAQYADRVLVLSEGRLLADGAPGEVFAQAELLAQARVRPPQVSELAFALRRQGVSIPRVPVTLAEGVALYGGFPHAG